MAKLDLVDRAIELYNENPTVGMPAAARKAVTGQGITAKADRARLVREICTQASHRRERQAEEIRQPDPEADLARKHNYKLAGAKLIRSRNGR